MTPSDDAKRENQALGEPVSTLNVDILCINATLDLDIVLGEAGENRPRPYRCPLRRHRHRHRDKLPGQLLARWLGGTHPRTSKKSSGFRRNPIICSANAHRHRSSVVALGALAHRVSGV